MPDNKEKLYGKLKEKGFYNKSYDDFKTQFSSVEKTNSLYEGLNKKGLYTKDRSSFINQFFPELKKSNLINQDNLYLINKLSKKDAEKSIYTSKDFANKIRVEYQEYKAVDNIELTSENRVKLNGIVKKMIQNKEPASNIRFVINDFKSIYGIKKNKSTVKIQNVKNGIPKSNNDFNYLLFIILFVLIAFSIFRFKKLIGPILKKISFLLEKHLVKIVVVIVVLIGALVISNPSRNDFASFQHWQGEKYIGRDKNYYIYSIYSNSRNEKRYIGILGNFFEIKY